MRPWKRSVFERANKFIHSPVTRCALLFCLPAFAPPQNKSQPSITIQSITAGAPDIGSVVYSSAGTTVFRVDAASGAVARQSGSGVRVSSGNASTALVTLTCAGGKNVSDCLTATDTITIGAAGTTTGMAGPLTNFTIAAGPVPPPVLSAATGTSTITFTAGDIPQGGTGAFYVGMDFPVLSAGSTGSATSSFIVTVGKGGQATFSTGTAAAKVIRPISLQELTSLSFGTIARPVINGGTVNLDPATGVLSVTGTGAGKFASPAPTRASYTVTGEGGQTFSISVLGFDMVNSGSTVSVTPSTYSSTGATIGGSVGGTGTTTVYVGGSFPISNTTSLGAYAGTLTITVQYN